MTSAQALPILYSFRRCPYAIRARLAIAYSGTQVELREVVLRDKPAAMLQASPKGTVPVLVLPDGKVIDESRNIMRWALQQNDPDGWLFAEDDHWLWEAEGLIQENDFVFKQHLDRYKYADRHPQHTEQYYREQCEVTVAKLERQLQCNNDFLATGQMTLADAAIFPFIRQFAHVDRDWFFASDYHHLQAWLTQQLESELFVTVMTKQRQWQEGEDGIAFP